MTLEQQFTSLCYHYVRPKNNSFPRILGNDIEEFQKHIEMLKKDYSIISPKDILNFYNSDYTFQNNKNILLTFDDGLYDHFEAAKILYEYNIKAIFFIPTCILAEKLPANPMIIHYCIAEFGVKKFLKAYHEVLNELQIPNEINYLIQYNKEQENIWNKIDQIKNFFKYKIEHSLSRKILIKIFQNIFLAKFPDALNIIHLNENKIKEIIKMGHSVGTHTHTHLSIGTSKLNSNDFKKEVVHPKKILEEKFNSKIFSFSYTFGEKQDCLPPSELLTYTKEYKLAFTVEGKKNNKNTSPLQLGRYMVKSKDTVKELSSNIEKIFNNS